MRSAFLALCLLASAPKLSAEARIERNVIYGMYSGLALLLDVHYPEQPNGLGIVFISGSGWSAPMSLSAPPLKEQQIPIWGPALLRAGYTVFAINHRATPRFHYPAPLEDVQRAIRFIRHNAAKYKIDPARIGGVGGSSGGNLIGLAAMVGAPGIAGDSDPVNRQSAALQCVILRAAPTDLLKMIGGSTLGAAATSAFVGRLPSPLPDDQQVFRDASPLVHVKPGSPPTLIAHGDADDTVPYSQAVGMEAALRAANVPVKLVRVAGGAHGPHFGTADKPHAQFPAVLEESVAWLDLHLKQRLP